MSKKSKKKSSSYKNRKSKKHDLHPGQSQIPQPISPESGSKRLETEQEHLESASPKLEPAEKQNKDTKSAKDQNEIEVLGDCVHRALARLYRSPVSQTGDGSSAQVYP